MEYQTVNERISLLESKISELQRQVGVLQSKIGIEESETVSVPVNIDMQKSPVKEDVQLLAVEETQQGSSVEVEHVDGPKSQHSDNVSFTEEITPEEIPFEKENASGVESTLGKKVMGILASILVFVSIVLFGNLILPYLTPAIKTAIMFVVSIAFAVVGLWKMGDGKGRYGILYTTIAGCGVGAIYISALVSRFLLETFNDWALMGVIVAWIAVVLVLVKLKSGIFSYICYAGILIGTALAVVQWNTNIFGAIVYVCAISALFAVNFSKDISKVGWLTLQYPVVCMLMLFAYYENVVYIYILYALVLIPLIAQIIYYKVDDNSSCIYLIANVLLYSVALFACTVCSLLCLYGSDIILKSALPNFVVVWPNVVLAVSLIVICRLLYQYMNTRLKEIFLLPYFISLLILSRLEYSQYIDMYLGSALFFVVLLILGTRLKNVFFRYAGYAFVFLYLGIMQAAELCGGGLFSFLCPTAIGVWGVILVYYLAICVMAFWIKRNYNVIDKYILTTLIFVGAFYFYYSGIVDDSVLYVMLGAVSLIINQPWYRRNLLTGEEENWSVRIGYISNEILAFVGIMLLRFSSSPAKFIVVIGDSCISGLILIVLMLVALACFNIKRIYTEFGEDNEKIVSVYTCIKISLIIFMVLFRAHSVNYAISLIGIVLAVAFICLGFYYNLKGVRFYGLVLCLICIAKLLLVDAEYSNSFMRPLGYLSAGLLCYLISWIYSKFEKKM